MDTMRKKILFLGLVLIAMAAISFQSYSKRGNLGNLILENIDALASEEWGNYVRCIGSGSLDCPVNHVKVDWIISINNLEGLY
ncbi:MAG: NVEALA domain-containing protein [Bacteroides sp.]|nr:NVEALA domain-containing protein [Bacteroides sp.]